MSYNHIYYNIILIYTLHTSYSILHYTLYTIHIPYLFSGAHPGPIPNQPSQYDGYSIRIFLNKL